MKHVVETTEWGGATPNHEYFLNDSMTELFAYIPEGSKEKITLRGPIKFDRKGRKFKVLRSVPDEIKEEGTPVSGKNGKVYYVSEKNGKIRCTCPGFYYRGKCSHTSS